MRNIFIRAFRHSYLAALLLITVSAEAQKYTNNPGYFEADGYRVKLALTPARRDTSVVAGKIDTVGTIIYWRETKSLWHKTDTGWTRIANGFGNLADYYTKTESDGRFVHYMDTAAMLNNYFRSINGLGGHALTLTTGTAGTDFNISSSVSTITLNLPDASATSRGAVTTGFQAFAGSKVFNNNISLLNVPAMGAPASVFMTLNSNVVNTRTASQVLSDIGGAPSSGSANYIWNGTTAQTADFNITGGGRLGGGLGVGTTVAPTTAKLYVASSSLPQLRLENSTGNRMDITTGANGSTSFNLTGTAPTFSFAQQIGANAGLTVTGNATFNTVPALGTPAATFLTLNSSILSSRTPAQVLSDINANLSNVLSLGSSALSDITLGATGNGNGYTYLARRLVGGTNYTVGFGASGNTGGGVYISTSNGTSAQDQSLRLINGTTAPVYSPDGGVTGHDVWHGGNHPQGSAFTPTLTGANVLATLTFNSAGHATGATTRTLTALDIGAIRNSTSPQTADLNITGTGTIGTTITSTVTSGSATGAVSAVGGLVGGQQGGQVAVYGGNHASRAGDISFHAGTGSGLQGERMTVDGATGSVGVNETSPGAQLDVRGTSSSTGAAFRVRNSTPAVLFQADNNGEITLFGGVKIITGTGSPEGAKTAPVGSMYLRTDGGASSTLYIKESGTGNTGWMSK